MNRHPPSIGVWDRLIRLLHWCLVSAVTLAWISTLGWGLKKWHEPAGWAALLVVMVRIIWGLTGTRYARFRQFVRPAGVLIDYVRRLQTGAAPRYIGHNPLGGWMILALLGSVVVTCMTGWLFTTDTFWGIRWVKILHETCAWLLLGLAAMHVVGVLVTSILHRENLVAAMITGRKASPQQGDQA